MKFGILLFAAFIFIASTERCISRVNPVSRGQPCSATTYCKYGNFCNDDGICEAVLGEGVSCKNNDECDSSLFLRCQGPENKKLCVRAANPGEQCSNDPVSTIPLCPYSCINNICQRAFVGDGCTANTDCFEPLTCAESTIKDQKICTGIADGANCTASAQCKPGSYCAEGFCNKKKTTGVCVSSGECAYGFICMRNSPSEETQCIARETKLAGEYCDGQPTACESLRCSMSYCATKSADVCVSGSDCAQDSTCRCGGDFLRDGVASCTRNPCYALADKYSGCFQENCYSGGNRDFSKSCVQLFCKKEYDAYVKCSGVSKVVLSSITFLLAFVALFLF